MNIHSTRRGGRRLLLCLLAVSAASIAIGTAQVQAATAEEDAGAIIVTGTRPIAESEASALEVQKQSDSLVTVAASDRSEEHTSELQSLMRISYAVFCLKKKKTIQHIHEVTLRDQTKNNQTTNTVTHTNDEL